MICCILICSYIYSVVWVCIVLLQSTYVSVYLYIYYLLIGLHALGGACHAERKMLALDMQLDLILYQRVCVAV